MKVDPKQILITSGAQQAFVIISYVLMNKNDNVWYENPGHIAGRDLMKIVGGDVSPIPIDNEGLNLPFAILNFPKPKGFVAAASITSCIFTSNFFETIFFFPVDVVIFFSRLQFFIKNDLEFP